MRHFYRSAEISQLFSISVAMSRFSETYQDLVHCRLAPVTQIVSTASLGCYYAKQLPFSMMLQTMAFVAFNKVGSLVGT